MTSIRNIYFALIAGVICIGVAPLALARGVSPYLPLGTSAEKEREFERVLILAGKPVVRRPVPAAIVLDALPSVCPIDPGLCARVRSYLERYQSSADVTQVVIEADLALGNSKQALPNSHGRTAQSNWMVAGSAYYQPNDYLLLNAGGLASEGTAVPTGTVLSIGFDLAQVDVGYRDHWLSPSALSSMLISTEAPTMPSITVSNYRPITPLGITYELFAARMSRQDGISYFGSTTSGYPNLAGIQLGIEPVVGYALTINRLMQYGGGERGGLNLARLRQAYFDSNSVEINLPDGTFGEEEFGNQVASVTGVMQFPGKVPFSASIEYAGEDNSYAGNYRLGDTALTLGLDFPLLWRRFDLRYEISEWQNVWYVHHLYPKGLTNDGFVLGHWFGDQRKFNDRVGGRSNVLQLGLRTDGGDYWQTTYRTMGFVSSVGYQSVPEVPYEHLQELSVRYSTSWKAHDVAAELTLGRDAFGEKIGRFGVSIDLAKGQSGFRDATAYRQPGVAGDQTEFFVDLGINRSRVFKIISAEIPNQWTDMRSDYHLGLGARRAVGNRSSLGVRLELDRVDSHSLLSLRALDYQFRLTRSLAANAFFGVGRYDYGAPAFGWYGGLGVQYMDVLPKWDVGVDWRRYDKLSRNRVLTSDPPNNYERPRMHFDINGQSLYISRRF